jgi:tRNA(Ile)-lysidine synthase
MNTFLHSKFEYNLINRLNIKPKSSLLIAISGGQDSLCLLKLSLDFQQKYNLNIGIIHINHQCRNDSNYNTQSLISFIKKYTIPVYLYQIIPSHYSEVEFRNLRYQLFLTIAQKYKYNIIATAHSLTDQVETCLHNFFRGASLDSLNSIIWSRNLADNIMLVKPLLNIKRSEIMWFGKIFQLPIWSDFSNLYYCSPRNRIRYELIPYLNLYFQEKIEDKIHHFLMFTQIDCEYLRQNTIKVYQKSRHPLVLALNKTYLISQHYALQIRVLHLFFLHNFNKSIPLNSLKKILNYYNPENIYSKSIFLHGICIHFDRQWIYCK